MIVDTYGGIARHGGGHSQVGANKG
ncbi:MAG: hypothetical protein ACLTS6_06545 [Anaerobutyricum sp.]